jgi:hypothetical protein
MKRIILRGIIFIVLFSMMLSNAGMVGAVPAIAQGSTSKASLLQTIKPVILSTPRILKSHQDSGSFTDCMGVSEIPPVECEALVALYNSTGGSGWTNHTDWLQTDTPCSWYGITCSSANVTNLDLNNNQLVGNIPTELSNLNQLTVLNLNQNQLSGSLPSSLIDLIHLQYFHFNLTSLCEPNDTSFQTWLSGIADLDRTNNLCSSEPTSTSTPTLTPTVNISGNAGIGGATLSYTDGVEKTVTADGTGVYSFSVSYDWSGTLTPSKKGYAFTPTSLSSSNLEADLTDQNYTAARVITTWEVTNANDSGTGSLRQAIVDSGPGDTIVFNSSLSGHTITLSSQLLIDHDLTIDGSSLSSKMYISGNNSVRVFNIPSGKTVKLINLDIFHGRYSSGAGIYNAGTLTLQNCNIDGNTGSDGAGIYNVGTLTLTNDTISGNSNSIFLGNCYDCGFGAGIYNSGSLTITNSTFSGNTSTRNTGGAIYNSGNLLVQDSNFSSNSVHNFNYLINQTQTVWVYGYGGAIYNSNNATITGSTFSGNSSEANGNGSAIGNYGFMTVTNSTFTSNTLTTSIYNHQPGTLIITNSTIFKNSINSGTNVPAGIYNYRGSLSLFNTILAGSYKGSVSILDCYNDNGTIAADVNNLIQANGVGAYACGTPALTGDPMLGSLANNGGPTKTLALLSGSPAIDAGDNDSCPLTDQRGIIRPKGVSAILALMKLL